MTSEQHRLHPAAIAVLALKALRDAAVPIVIVLASSRAGSTRERWSATRSTSCSASPSPR